MDNYPSTTKEKLIGDTIYIVESVVSQSAKETIENKLKRLLLNDTTSLPLKNVS